MAHYFNERRTMPQIDDMPDLYLWLKERGVGVTYSLADPYTLHNGQIGVMFNAARFGWSALSYPVLVSADDHIIDGHHRNEAHKRVGTPTPVLKLDVPFSKALDMIRAYHNAHHEENVI